MKRTMRRTMKRTMTRRRTQKGGFGESIIEPVKNTSKNVINAAENGLGKVTNVIGNTANSIKQYFASFVGGKRRKRRNSHRR